MPIMARNHRKCQKGFISNSPLRTRSKLPKLHFRGYLCAPLSIYFIIAILRCFYALLGLPWSRYLSSRFPAFGGPIPGQSIQFHQIPPVSARNHLIPLSIVHLYTSLFQHLYSAKESSSSHVQIFVCVFRFSSQLLHICH